ncbi:YadA-like family protein [Paraburkholderia sp. PREW-6R]|uniref:YadA-like family protein n=1 Tax=Paraburkholderia sp. PREW-6R TaxID=3141544 RepID=UPI0031F4B8BE
MLNKTYKTVWNRATRAYVAVSELTRSRGASGGSGASVYDALVAVGASLVGVVAFASTANASDAALNPLINVPATWDADALTGSSQPSDSAASQIKAPALSATASQPAAPVLKAATVTDDTSATQYIAVSPIITPGLTTTAMYGQDALAVGVGATSIADRALAVGAAAGAARANSTAVGAAAAALALNTTAVGAGASTNSFADNAVAVGYLAAAQNVNALAIGTRVQTNAVDSIAAGSDAYIPTAAARSVAFGAGSTASAANAVALGAGSIADVANTVSVGSSSLQRQVTNVAAGVRGTDAANISQLSSAVSALGGGAGVAGDGTVIKPTYKIGGMTFNDVGAALAVAANAGTQASADSVQYDSSAHDSVTLGNTATPVRVSNLRAGTLSAASTDAVNGAQLFTTNQAVTQNTNSITNLDQRVTTNTNNISKLDQRVTDNTTNINSLDERVTNNTTDISTLDQRVTDNTTTITNLDQRVTDNTTNISKVNQQLIDNTTNITDLDQRVTTNSTDITNLDARTTTVEGNVTNLTNQINLGEIGVVQQDPTSRTLTVGKDMDGTRVDFSGTSGARELTGITAGTTDASAVNVAQIKPMVAALGGGALLNADGSLTGPTYHVQGGTQGTVGDALGSLDDGLNTLKQSMETGGVGIVTQDPASRTISVGATTDGNLINMAGTAGNRVVTGVAAGAVNAKSGDAINGAQLYAQSASTALALGGGATVNADGTVSAPSYSVGGTVVNNVGSAITNLDGRVSQNSSDIAGLQNTVGNISGAVANAVQYDSSAHDRVTLGGTAANAPKVQLTNLQDGEISATSTDAVTGAQLWNTNQQISNLGQTVQNVQNSGNPYVAVNSGGNAARAVGNGSVAIGGGAIASAPNSVAIGENSVADVTNTVSVGSAGSERRITNVAPGQAATDAVNMQQFQGGMSDIARSAYTGTASAIALTMVPEVDANKNLAIGVGTAGYKGYQAVAVGVSARVTQNLKVKLGAGISSATTTVGAGAAYQW